MYTNMQFITDWGLGPANVLEPLKPLSSDLWLLDEEVVSDVKKYDLENVEKISRTNAADLLAELDKNKEEPEFYDWLEPENSNQLSIFDDVPVSLFKKNNEDFLKPPFEVFFKNEDSKSFGIADNAHAKVGAFQARNVDYTCGLPDVPFLAPYTAATTTVDNLLKPEFSETPYVETVELITPPESPKHEEIVKLLLEIEPDELEKLVGSRIDIMTDGCSSIPDDFSDYVSSPFVSSDSGMDDSVSSPSSVVQTVEIVGGPVKRKKSYRTYAKGGVVDKKERKKEQNKNAATRYRLKKKAEIEVILSEENELEEKNKALHEQVDEISREIKYLKNLMRDVYKAKGLDPAHHVLKIIHKLNASVPLILISWILYTQMVIFFGRGTTVNFFPNMD